MPLYHILEKGLLKGIVPPEGLRGEPVGTGSHVRVQAPDGSYIVARRDRLIELYAGPPPPAEEEEPTDDA